MAHQSLYRKYRPQSFNDVVGQSHITRTLRNAVAENAVAHAYLFTGPRGTGKTTTARILAKALNCSIGPTPDPDTTCQDCLDIAEGRHPDIHELDAASRTQVENVREEIIGRVAYAPTRGTWKVYIIDEVHMLSTHSFNALLKTIEEPPARTVFILCTTHPHKVPETIHSRCQRFDFHRIGIEDIVGRLRHIATSESIEVSDSALTMVAKHALGGMRDAISTLEQLAAFTGKKITLDDVEDLLGEVDSALLFELADLIAHRDIAGGFRFVARLAETGADLSEFVREFTGHVRDLYVTAAVGDSTDIVDTTDDSLAKLTAQAKAIGGERLARILDLLGEVSGEMRRTPDPRLALEVTLTRIARPQGELTLEALAERIESLERGVSSAVPTTMTPAQPVAPAPAAPAAPAPATKTPTEDSLGSAASATGATNPQGSVQPKENPGQAAAPSSATGAVLDRASVKRSWPAVMAEIKRAKATRAAFFSAVEVDMDADGKTVVLEFSADQEFSMKLADTPETKDLMRNALAAVFGSPPPFRYQLGRGPVRPVETASESSVAPTKTSSVEAPPVVTPETSVAESGAQSTASDQAEAERLLDELGAEFVDDRPKEQSTE
ncbi:MAG: DNA polymerase III subunit gamma/tau [Actinomycetota bacterium]|nr:DNA polymerase III subunit gamma/tau [Actinomycetota bacterium]